MMTSRAASRASTPATLRRRLQGDLDTIVAKALRKRPDERYASVAALADDIERHRGLRPIGARPNTRAYRAGRFIRRHRMPALNQADAARADLERALVLEHRRLNAGAEHHDTRLARQLASAARP